MEETYLYTLAAGKTIFQIAVIPFACFPRLLSSVRASIPSLRVFFSFSLFSCSLFPLELLFFFFRPSLDAVVVVIHVVAKPSRTASSGETEAPSMPRTSDLLSNFGPGRKGDRDFFPRLQQYLSFRLCWFRCFPLSVRYFPFCFSPPEPGGIASGLRPMLSGRAKPATLILHGIPTVGEMGNLGKDGDGRGRCPVLLDVPGLGCALACARASVFVFVFVLQGFRVFPSGSVSSLAVRLRARGRNVFCCLQGYRQHRFYRKLDLSVGARPLPRCMRTVGRGLKEVASFVLSRRCLRRNNRSSRA